MTYTVVARTPRAIGAATCSHSTFLAAKTVHVAADLPAIAVSQAFSSPAIGLAALDDVRAGLPVTAAGHAALSGDDDGDLRQLLVVTPDGVAAATGRGCVPSFGDGVDADRTVAVAGNMLADDAVIPAMLTAAEEHAPVVTDPEIEQLIARLLAALLGGSRAGGDFRGDRSAALVVVGTDGAARRVTVDDHDDPTAELARLAAVSRTDAVLRRCMAWLQSTQPADPALRAEVVTLVGTVPTAEAWVLLLDGAPAPAGADQLTRRMVEAFAPIRDRYRSKEAR